MSLTHINSNLTKILTFQLHITFPYRYPNIPFYLQVGNPYLDDNVDQHTDKLLERYEQLVDRVMQSSDMNHVYVLPQLHTLLWSNKKGV